MSSEFMPGDLVILSLPLVTKQSNQLGIILELFFSEDRMIGTQNTYRVFFGHDTIRMIRHDLLKVVDTNEK